MNIPTRILAIIGTALALTPLGCPKQAGHGSAVNRVKCDTIDYEARSLSARVEIPDRAGVELDTSKQAIRDVDEWVEKYFASWQTACSDYRNGALTREEYRDETQRIRQKMERFEELAIRLEKAGSSQEFDFTLRETWNSVVPEERRTDMEMELRVMVKRPGDSDFQVAPPGAALPGGTEVYTLVALTQTATLQIYQVDAQGARVDLFPHSQNPQSNPLPGGQEVRVPATGVFELDDKDLGIEDIHVLATSSSAAAPTGGDARREAVVDCKTRGLKFVPDKCPRSRGLVYKPEPGRASLKGTNAAAQDGLHLVYSFHHVGDPKLYGKKCPDDPRVNCRGVEPMRGVIERRPPTMPGNFDACPGNAAPKEMSTSGGSYERWCVEENATKQLVDHGPYRKWHPAGKLWIQGQLDMGHRVGTWITYDATGKELAKLSY